MTRVDVTMPEQHRAWQMEALAGMARRRNSVVVAHRRAGKTEIVAVRLLLAALGLRREHPAPLFGYVAPFLNQAKAVVWGRLKHYARKIPRTAISESELTVRLVTGSTIRAFGADYPDRLRGLGFDGVVMDEVAQMRPETWPEVVRPALADRQGWAVFIGTPKGQNVFYELHQTALADPDNWFSGLYRADRTGVLPAEELDRLRAEMGADVFSQEFLCDFTAANTNNFIDFQAVHAASTRERPLVNPAPLVFGLDVARFGDDRTVLVRRRGPVLEDVAVWRGRDLMATASETAAAINWHKPRAVFVDVVGIGAGVVDRLRQLGHRVIGINSGAKPSKPERFINLKAEMWQKMREWLDEGGIIPDRLDLKNDLLAPTYEFDHSGRLKIESKDDLKSRGLPSTDLADALALTFAQPVAAADVRAGRPKYAEMD